MKKLISIFLLSATVLLSCISLSGCSFIADLIPTVSIENTEINEKGELIISYSDGTKKNLGVVVGEDGRDGAEGSKSILSAAINDKGELILTYTDESEQNLGVIVGEDGEDVSLRVERAEINEKGELILYYTDKTTENLGVVVGKDGEDAKDPPINLEINVTGDAENVAAAVAFAAPSVVSIIVTRGGLVPTMAAASGVILSLDKEKGDALIVTNYHLVYDDETGGIVNDIDVFVYGSYMQSQAISAEFVGGSMREDIAVLSVKGSERLKNSIAKAATIADSDALHPGDTAIAIGNPMGKGISATYGKVNVPSENFNTLTCDEKTEITLRVIRVDTAVNKGNSGGGVYDGQGRLIGIVSAKSIEKDIENVGFILPSNKVLAVAQNIDAFCSGGDYITPLKPTFGVEVRIVDSVGEVNAETGLIDIVETVEVAKVTGGSVAYGVFEVGDRLVSVKVGDYEKAVTRLYHLPEAAWRLRPGESLLVTVLRGGEEVTLTLTPADSTYKPC